MPKFEDAPIVAEIARELIEAHHGHLVEAKIKYLFRRGNWKQKGRVVFGKAFQASERDKHLHGHDFIVVVSMDAWAVLTPAQKRALVDHELSHCGRDLKGQWCLWPHDLEDFVSVVKRHGLWSEEVQQFAKVAKTARLPLPEDDQLTLLKPEAAGGDGQAEVA